MHGVFIQLNATLQKYTDANLPFCRFFLIVEGHFLCTECSKMEDSVVHKRREASSMEPSIPVTVPVLYYVCRSKIMPEVYLHFSTFTFIQFIILHIFYIFYILIEKARHSSLSCFDVLPALVMACKFFLELIPDNRLR